MLATNRRQDTKLMNITESARWLYKQVFKLIQYVLLSRKLFENYEQTIISTCFRDDLFSNLLGRSGPTMT